MSEEGSSVQQPVSDDAPRPSSEYPAQLDSASARGVGNDTAAASLNSAITQSKMYARIGYFLVYAGQSACGPFYSLLLKNIGFSERSVGMVMALQPFCTLFVLSPVAYVADRYHYAFFAIKICAVVSVASLLAVTLLGNSAGLFLIVVLMFVHFAVRCVLGPFYDQRTLSILPKDRKEEWGSLRCFGGIGWGVFAPCATLLVEHFGWWISAVLLGAGLGSALFCYCQMKPVVASQPTERKFRDVLLFAVKHTRVLLFLVAECFMGLGYSLIGTYLFIFLESIGGPKVLMGLSISMTVIVEVPVFQFSRLLHARFTDRQLLSMSMIAWSIRVVGYSFLHRPWLVLLLEPMHGLTFGLMWVSGIHFVSRAFPASLSHSANGFLSAAAFGAGPIFGNICGGQVYSSFGPRTMFRAMSVIMTLLGVMFYVLDGYFESKGFSIVATENGEVTASGDRDLDSVKMAASPVLKEDERALDLSEKWT